MSGYLMHCHGGVDRWAVAGAEAGVVDIVVLYSDCGGRRVALRLWEHALIHWGGLGRTGVRVGVARVAAAAGGGGGGVGGGMSAAVWEGNVVQAFSAVGDGVFVHGCHWDW